MVSSLARLAVAASVAASASAAASHGCSGVECTHEPADSKVNVLTADNFHRFIKRHPLVLMEFYAPWCGHCQSLAPEFRAAAKDLGEMDLPVPVTLAKIDDGNDANRALRGGCVRSLRAALGRSMAAGSFFGGLQYARSFFLLCFVWFGS
eukprot:SAG22_NODE_6377_length_864_cov_2.033987_1_plen_149_part_10